MASVVTRRPATEAAYLSRLVHLMADDRIYVLTDDGGPETVLTSARFVRDRLELLRNPLIYSCVSGGGPRIMPLLRVLTDSV
jgi:hypothetical protein